ncbi:MAG: hypothetical protein A2X40_08095 [Elusimicrobia bacterium GWC2_65_9]|nr:MAG: hypothetical protein A2X40_08095 [Elusimicrobia bacterium GWC2_65_9]
MFHKPIASIVSAAVLVAGPGHLPLFAAAQTMTRGAVTGVSATPRIAAGLNGSVYGASSYIPTLTPGALAVPSLNVAANPALVPVAAKTQVPVVAKAAPVTAQDMSLAVSALQEENGDVAKKDAALNALFENSTGADLETPEEMTRRVIGQLNARKPVYNRKVQSALALVEKFRRKLSSKEARIANYEKIITAVRSDFNPPGGSLEARMIERLEALRASVPSSKEQLVLAEKALQVIQEERARFVSDRKEVLAQIQADLNEDSLKNRAVQDEIARRKAAKKDKQQAGGLLLQDGFAWTTRLAYAAFGLAGLLMPLGVNAIYYNFFALLSVIIAASIGEKYRLVPKPVLGYVLLRGQTVFWGALLTTIFLLPFLPFTTAFFGALLGYTALETALKFLLKNEPARMTP